MSPYTMPMVTRKRAKLNFADEQWDGYSKWLHFRKGSGLDALVYDLQLNEDNVDEYYGKTLKGYQRLLFDRFDYRTSTACEIGILYGETEESMLIQYQFFFMENGCTYLITMTSRADEEAYLNTLDTYDLFLADFEPAQG